MANVLWQRMTRRIDNAEPRWPASLALLVAIVLYVSLPGALIVGPRWLIPTLEVVLIIPLTVVNPYRDNGETKPLRIFAIATIAVINVANIGSVALLVHYLLHGRQVVGTKLVYSAVLVWLTNVIIFGLWFWELDRGGPAVRGTHKERNADFQFPQMVSPDPGTPRWRPSFIDYLYTALTNATAFSPTDAMPLTPTSKSLMGAESLVSLVTVVVVAARAVNILH